MQAAFATGAILPHPDGPNGVDFGEPEYFVPQRAIAMKRAKLIIGFGVLLLVLLALLAVG
jgi:hypothetical protein